MESYKVLHCFCRNSQLHQQIVIPLWGQITVRSSKMVYALMTGDCQSVDGSQQCQFPDLDLQIAAESSWLCSLQLACPDPLEQLMISCLALFCHYLMYHAPDTIHDPQPNLKLPRSKPDVPSPRAIGPSGTA